MLFALLLGLGGVLALVGILVALRPARYRIERSTTIAAPPRVVMDLIEDFHQWKRWSPWDKMDPTQVVTITGKERGVGARYHWVGKKNGEGRMEIVETRRDELVGVQLDFIKPFPNSCRCDFELKPTDDGTIVWWIMTGTNGFMGKAFDLVANMDRMLGRDFDSGLAAMKAEAERQAAAG